jgi:hypothetical protein
MRNRPATSSPNADSESPRKILEGIALGERAFIEGRVISHDDARARLERWLDESDDSAQKPVHRTGN